MKRRHAMQADGITPDLSPVRFATITPSAAEVYHLLKKTGQLACQKAPQLPPLAGSIFTQGSASSVDRFLRRYRFEHPLTGSGVQPHGSASNPALMQLQAVKRGSDRYPTNPFPRASDTVFASPEGPAPASGASQPDLYVLVARKVSPEFGKKGDQHG